MTMLERIWELLGFKPATKPVKQRDWCGWCHKTNCKHPDWETCRDQRMQCEYHPEVKDGSAPSFCHRCATGWTPRIKWVKPTIYVPNANKADTRWCLEWICLGCFTRDEERRALAKRKYNNTLEAAQLVFKEKDGALAYEGWEPIEADFPVSHESLAPYVTRIIDGANEWHYHGLDFDTVVIREGRVYTRDDRGEWEVTWESKKDYQ
jgi:hypothetical protein